MFFDPCGQETFVIDRVSGAGRSIRRVLVLRDDSILLCKLSGVVTRIINLASLTHLVFGSCNGIRAGLVLLRIAGEHDVLFTHPPENANVARIAISFIERMTTLRGLCTGPPMNNVERNDEQMIREAANVARPLAYVKPKGFAIDNQVLVPLLFDTFEIPADAGIIAEELDLFVDATFVTMLSRAVDQHPLSAKQPPLVAVDVPPPFRSLEIGAKFLGGFFRAYERELPLVINMHSHLPSITSFRASKRFWAYAQRLLQVSRSPAANLGAISINHVEVYVVGEEQYPITATLKEWNDAMIQWELEVRNPERLKKTVLTADTDVFWKTFVAELERAKIS